ncbi:MAG: hypothetical protein ACKV2U_24480 [Bryobacteraceae bacterium]
MSLTNFQYGIGAVVLPAQLETFHQLRDGLVETTRPGNFAEQLVVDQLLHAQWELHRVRQHANHAEAEESLHAAFTRATRNWQRASRQLAALQSARASAELCGEIGAPNSPLLANLAKVPRRKNSTASFQRWRIATIEDGCDGPAYFDRFYGELNKKEAA